MKRALLGLLLALAAPSLAPAAEPPAVDPGLQAWLTRVTEAKERGDDVRVVLFCGEALRDFPGDPVLLNAKATAQNRTKDYQGALATAELSLSSDTKNAVAYANKAYALAGVRDYDGMLAALKTAASLDRRFEGTLGAVSQGGDPVAVFERMSRSRTARKGVPAFVWVVAAAGGGFAVTLLLVLSARSRLPPEPEAEPGEGEEDEEEGDWIEPGEIIGENYRIEAELSRSGLPGVFAALDEKRQARVAIKRVKRAANIAKLPHPGIAEVHAVLDVAGELLLVFELVEGRTLGKAIAANRSLAPAEAGRILGVVASTLDFIHEKQMVHGDLKPSGIVLGKEGVVKLLDFGLPPVPPAELSDYAAPEQSQGTVTPASDLYALGAIAYEAVCGAKAFSGPGAYERKLRREFTPPSARGVPLPKGLDAFFAKALQPEAGWRPSSGAAFMIAFDEACRS